MKAQVMSLGEGAY